MVNEKKTALVQRLEARGRIAVDVDVEGFITAGGKELGKVKLWIATLTEQERAAVQGREHVKQHYKSSPESLNDPDVMSNSKTVHILHAITRDYNDPHSLQAFPSPKWMMDNLTRDEIACLMNHYDVAATQLSALKYSLSDEDIDKLIEFCVATNKAGLPPMHLANLPEPVLREVVQRVCVKLAGNVRREDDSAEF